MTPGAVNIGVAELIALSPMILMGVTSLALMLSAAWHRCHVTSLLISLAGLAIAFALTFFIDQSQASIAELLVMDGYGLFAMRLILVATFVVALLSFEELRRRREHSEEFYIALSISCLGALCMCAANHFASFFLGLELLTVPIYAMIAYFDERHIGLEAAVKYIILAGASAAFLLFGMALIYAQLGSLRFDLIAERWMPMWSSGRLILLMGLAWMITGVGFKLSVVPFHMWTPDVYQGAPSSVTAYLATVSKGAMMMLFLRFFTALQGSAIVEWQWILSTIAILSMFGGNLLALLQKNIKRILAYSSIAHMGYVLVAFLSSGSLATSAVLFYLTTYFATILLAFGILILLENEQGELENIDDFRGLIYVRPWLSGALILAFLSLVGIPLTAGFMGKYWILLAGVNDAQWSLLFSLVISSGIGLYAYLRVVIALFQSHTPVETNAIVSRWEAKVTVVVLTLVTLMLGVLPNAVTDAIAAALT